MVLPPTTLVALIMVFDFAELVNTIRIMLFTLTKKDYLDGFSAAVWFSIRVLLFAYAIYTRRIGTKVSFPLWFAIWTIQLLLLLPIGASIGKRGIEPKPEEVENEEKKKS